MAPTLRKLDTLYNPTVIKDNEPGVEVEKENEIVSPPVEIHYLYNASLASNPGIPRTYENAMSGPDRSKWLVENAMSGPDRSTDWERARKLWKTKGVEAGAMNHAGPWQESTTHQVDIAGRFFESRRTPRET